LRAPHYNYFRDYDPSVGRYIESDTIGLGGGVNTYGYVGGAPQKFADRKGLCVSDDACCSHPVAQRTLSQFGGTVMCCMGRKVACVAPLDGPEPGKSLLMGCTRKHEERHLQDVECGSNNTIETANWTTDANQGECAAYRVQLGCLRDAGPQCGGNNLCENWIRTNITDLTASGNRKYRCGF
jgi:hypothetical protein